MKYKTQEFKGLDKEITELTGDKETSGTELNAVQIDCAMISPSISLALTWPLGQATHTRLPMALANLLSPLLSPRAASSRLAAARSLITEFSPQDTDLRTDRTTGSSRTVVEPQSEALVVS